MEVLLSMARRAAGACGTRLHLRGYSQAKELLDMAGELSGDEAKWLLLEFATTAMNRVTAPPRSLEHKSHHDFKEKFYRSMRDLRSAQNNRRLLHREQHQLDA
jgi:hypothetical protein